MIYIDSKKRKLELIQEEYPDAFIFDVTSESEQPSGRTFSPFMPHYDSYGNLIPVPIPFTDPAKCTAACVEGVWQGLKVFKNEGVDFEAFRKDTGDDIKRNIRHTQEQLGHRKGAYGTEILGYFEARMLIYLPTYKWVLDNVPKVHDLIMRLGKYAKTHDVVLLDYSARLDYDRTEDVCDTTRPLSHAGLMKLYAEGNYPDPAKGLNGLKEMTKEQAEARHKEVEAKRNARRKAARQAAKAKATASADLFANLSTQDTK